ncbi:MAG TPA: PAS domain-containing protein [Phenylobacterium sp.]
MFSVAVMDDGEFRFEGFSPEAQRLTGMTNPEVVGRTPDEATPGNAAVVNARYRECVREGVSISYLETLEFPTGSSHWRTTLEPVRDETGRIVRILGRARQVELLDGTQEELTEAEFQRALDLFPSGMALLDVQGVVLFANSTWRKFGERYGDTESSIGHSYVDLCRRSTSAGLPDGTEVEPKLRQLVTAKADHFGHAYSWRDRHFVLRATRVVLNGRHRIVMAHQDVTDVVSARALAARLAEDLLHAQEEERSRIALELHDSTSQHLVAIGLSLAAIGRNGATPTLIDDIRHSLSEAQREIRSLTYLLYPPKLSSDGLEETLRRFTEGYMRRSGVSLTINIRGSLNDLPQDMQFAVLRVVQEALGNVQRHAQARTVAIDVVLEKQGLHLRVVDDGATEAEEGELAPTGVGIRGMQARFAQFAGKLTVTRGPEGTTVEGFMPR